MFFWPTPTKTEGGPQKERGKRKRRERRGLKRRIEKERWGEKGEEEEGKRGRDLFIEPRVTQGLGS